ncbi:MAG: metallophosphoesterase [Ferruginibacter sp.]
MKIQYCSDLHLEFPENKKYIEKHFVQPAGEILLLAGDILPLNLDPRHYPFFKFIADNFEAVYWIPGNHEYYGSDIGKSNDPIHEKIYSNVFLVNNKTIDHNNVSIICSTMWSYIRPENELILQKSLADFSSIYFNGRPFLPFQFNQLHQASLAFIKSEAGKQATSKNIVLTHHVPTFYNYPTKYKKSVLSDGFAVELHDYINDSNIDYWIYGHHHYNTPSFTIGNTELITNQLGYVKQREYKYYKKDAVFEI